MDHKLDDIRRVVDKLIKGSDWTPKPVQPDDDGMLYWDDRVKLMKSQERAVDAIVEIYAILSDQPS